MTTSAPLSFTVIIPAPEYSPDLPVLRSLRAAARPTGPCEILVATGRNPSRQRNVAIEAARGDILVFLDSDCQIDPEHLIVLERLFSKRQADIAGGPVLLQRGSPDPQPLFQALLACPAVTGRASSRYARKDALRATDESELILCNLAVRSALFREFGLFCDALYPNEENEWLDRSRGKSTVLHAPSMAVARPQRASWGEFYHMLIRYGRGRTEQSLQTRSFHWAKQSPVLLLAAGAVLLVLCPPAAVILLILGWLAAALAIGLLFGGKRRWRVALAAPTVVIAFAIGQAAGFLSWAKKRPDESPVELRNVTGEALPASR